MPFWNHTTLFSVLFGMSPASWHRHLNQKSRILYLLCALITIGLGLASRRYASVLPPLIAPYLGDTLWALMAFFFIRALFPHHSTRFAGSVALAFCYLVEISQLYHAPWIDAIRHTRFGGLILGFGFLWSDIVCYTVGVLMGTLLDLAGRRRLDTTPEQP